MKFQWAMIDALYGWSVDAVMVGFAFHRLSVFASNMRISAYARMRYVDLHEFFEV